MIRIVQYFVNVFNNKQNEKLFEINRIDKKMKKRKVREDSELYSALLSKRNTIRTQLK